ncbi:armadillo-type protein [Crucibulum laeve]|uniref:Importin-13 n=1 Tax=Crucibulum laeve TaxID=68775 RepID=A0A5C3LLB6_9AGAR|nr:armadillo-type protein [Crucibulum laeve]
MADTSFLPALSSSDVDRAVQLIQQAYAPPTPATTPEDLRRYQQEVFEIQKHPEAWGLVIPMLDHQDQNVQFFGAHTAQVKIARDWDTFPSEHAERLRDLLVQLTAHAIAIGRSKFILRKLFVALTSLALKLVPGRPTRWPDWILACVAAFSGRGAPVEHIHDFLSIVAEEVNNADLIGASKSQMAQTLSDAVPMVVQSITSSINQPLQTILPQHVQSVLKCFQAWSTLLPSNDLTPLIPMLIGLLDPIYASNDGTVFIAASDALQEIMSKSSLSDGSGNKTLTEPLLLWLDAIGSPMVDNMLTTGDFNDTTHSLCKLIVALGDHSTAYLASNIASTNMVANSGKTKSYLVQTFMRLMLAFTGLPGYYGADEEESEMTLGFWYLFQEALWSTDFYFEDGGEEASVPNAQPGEQVVVAKAVYIELVKVLRRKVVFPPPGSGWSKDQLEKFQVYRRDIGDTLINAYYILRDDMLGYYVSDIAERLAAKRENEGWQDIEATLHCVMSVQEALDLEKTLHLPRLFGPEILGRLPTTGHGRIRRTTLGVIGAYASWFATLPAHTPASNEPNLLMTVLGYVVSALTDPSLCLQAAVALRNLCDANRKALAPHIAAFGELHAGLEQIPDSERGKVLQSIASVIQALPPDQEIPPIEGIVNPIILKLDMALQSSSVLPDEARAMAILQLETLAGIAKGLTRTTEGLFVLEDETPEATAEMDKINTAREDLRMIKLRESIFAGIRSVVDLWSSDAGINHALSDLFKSITSLPVDTTLISLPAGPLLELVCLAMQRSLTAAWLSLATIMIAQLNPPVFSLTLKSGPTPEAEAVVTNALPIILHSGLGLLSRDGAMAANPDIVQEFYGCMDRVAQDFTSAFYNLPPGALDTLVRCAINCLELQERYSLVAACNFLSTLIHRSSVIEELAPHKAALLATHGPSIMRAVLQGFAAVAPRSVVPNLIEMLGTLMSRAGGSGTEVGGGAALWMKNILFADDFVSSKAGPEAKEKFLKAAISSRSLKRTRDAAQQFTLIARGLEGSSFGYASVSM